MFYGFSKTKKNQRIPKIINEEHKLSLSINNALSHALVFRPLINFLGRLISYFAWILKGLSFVLNRLSVFVFIFPVFYYYWNILLLIVIREGDKCHLIT